MRPTLYIANRGEIALRILRTAKTMGFRTAVGYADQDAELPFVREADVSFSLKGEEALETYLNFDKVIAAAKSAKAQYLHPGYGFLSENAQFVDRISEEGIKFIGPSSTSMRLLGDKIGSRNFLKGIGIPLLPSYDGDDQTEDALIREARNLGFPLLIKPSAGGGGKGMLRVDQEREFIEKLQSSKRIARAAFNDDRVFLERFIEKARHIEVQILADEHGNVHSIGERECSLQKRHQKVVEEAPAAFLPEELRQKLWTYSKRIAKEAKYSSLGTVEWIWDGAEGIYFLEVNARLQVEHPVTELVWGLDLVDMQLKVTRGGALTELPISPRGHAIEVRVCAEDPAKDFLPSGGKIHRLKLPTQIRSDFGYAEKNSVPPNFDSLMGKLISHGETREEARLKLIAGLKELCIFGLPTNRSYLLQLLQHPEVIEGRLSTSMIANIPYEFDLRAGIDLLRTLKTHRIGPAESDSEDFDLFSPWGNAAQEISSSDSFFFEDFGRHRYFHSEFADWAEERGGSAQKIRGEHSQTEIDLEIRSPMPGKVIKVLRKAGETLKKGEVVLVLEAMKMEHQIKVSADARIAEIMVKEGDRVPLDAEMVRLEGSK